MLANDILVFGKVNAECLVGGHETLNPLNIGCKPGQRRIRFGRRLTKLLALKAAHRGYVTLDDEFLQWHYSDSFDFVSKLT